MVLKVVQVNIWKGKFLEELIGFLRRENPDIITIQEATSKKENLYEDKNIVLFDWLAESLQMNGAVAPSFGVEGHKDSYQGNAVLTRGRVLSKKVVWLREYNQAPLKEEERDYSLVGRNILDLEVELNGFRLHAISSHLSWSREPILTPEKLRQAKLLARYIKSLKDEPFLLGVDTNMTPESEVVQVINQVANNALARSNVKNTLNPTVHKVFRQESHGLLVDYIYTSGHFKIESIEAPEVSVSDHLPIVAVLSHE